MEKDLLTGAQRVDSRIGPTSTGWALVGCQVTCNAQDRAPWDPAGPGECVWGALREAAVEAESQGEEGSVQLHAKLSKPGF